MQVSHPPLVFQGTTFWPLPSQTHGPGTNQTVQPNLAGSLQPVVSENRVVSTLERSLNLVSTDGRLLGTLQLPIFLKHLYHCLEEVHIKPKHFDIAGGAVAYLIGPVLAKRFADKAGICAPHLSEFNRLKDIDLSIDLEGYPDHILWEMIYYVIRAIQKSGIHKSQAALFDSVFLKKMVSEQQGLCILSMGDPNEFWVDFSFTTRGPRHLFVRDNWKYNLISFISNKKHETSWTTTTENLWLPLQNRLEMKLDIDHVETINHLGFPLAAYYMARGYTISNPTHLYTLSEPFIQYHQNSSKKYIDTFQTIRKSHIGEDNQVFERMVVICLKILLFRKNSKLIEFFQDCDLPGNSPEARLVTFIKNKGMERYRMTPYDIFCLADLMGVEPRLHIPETAWTDFFQKKMTLNKQDRRSLFYSKDSLPLIITKKILSEGVLTSLSASEVFDILESNDLKGDKKAFMEIKFDWEIQHVLKKALDTFKNYRDYLQNDRISHFLDKALSINSLDLQPYFPLVFAEAFDEKNWIEKLIKEGFVQEAIKIALDKDSKEIFAFTLELLLEKDKLRDFTECLNKISLKNPELHKILINNKNWQEKFSQYSLDTTEFLHHLNEYLSKQDYHAAEKLLKYHAGKFAVSSESVEKIFSENYLDALKNSDFDRLSFLMEMAITSKVKEQKLLEIVQMILQHLLSFKLKDSTKLWALNFFTQKDLLPLMSKDREQLLTLAASCKDAIAGSHAETMLNMALDLQPSSQNTDLFSVISLCLKSMQAHKIKPSAEIKCKLAQLATQLLKSKDCINLLVFLFDLRALNLKLQLPEQLLYLLLELQDTPKKIHSIAKAMDALCKLPENIARQLTERYLQNLAMSKPSQACSLFKSSAHLWENSPQALKALYDSLSVEAPVKYTVFLSFPEWRKEEWQQMASLQNLNEDRLFQLLMDPRSRDFVDASWIHHFIVTQSSSWERSLCLIDTFPIPTHEEFFLGYLKRLKHCGFPLYESKSFLKKILQLEHKTISEAFVIELKILLKNLHKKSPSLLIDTTVDLETFIPKLPPQAKKDFIAYYLELLPKDFEGMMFGTEERSHLYSLIDSYAIESPFSVYLGMTDPSKNKIEAAFKLLLEKKFFKQDKDAQKKILCIFTQMISENPTLWNSLGLQFIDEYLFDRNLPLSSKEIVQALSGAHFPELQFLCLDFALKVSSAECRKAALHHLEDLIAHNEFTMVHKVLCDPKFSNWIQNGYLAVSFKKAVDRFLIQWIEFGEQVHDKNNLRLILTEVIQQIKYCNYKDQSFDNFFKKMAGFIGRGLEKSAEQDLFYYEFMDEFVNRYIELYQGNAQKGSTRTASLLDASEEMQRPYPAKISKFHIDIAQTLLSKFEPNIQNQQQQKAYINHLLKFFQKILPPLNPDAKELLISPLQDFVQNFFAHPLLYQNDDLCKEVFYTLNMALSKQVYVGHFYNLLETANCFSGLRLSDIELPPRRYEILRSIFNTLVKDGTFAYFWNNLTQISHWNIHIVHAFKTYAQNFVFSLPPEPHLFDFERPNFETFVLTMLPMCKISMLKPDIYSWCVYLGFLPPKIDESSFCQSIHLIASNFPKEYRPSCLLYLLGIFVRSIDTQKLPVTKAIVESLNVILSLYPPEKASSDDVFKLKQFLSSFLMYFNPKTAEEHCTANIFVGIIIKWLLTSAQQNYDFYKINATFNNLHLLIKSPLFKGSSIMLCGSLKKITDIVCSNYTPLCVNIPSLLLQIFDVAINPKCELDVQSQSLLAPVIYYICEKIISTLGREENESLEKLLCPDDPAPILRGDQIQKLKDRLKNFRE